MAGAARRQLDRRGTALTHRSTRKITDDPGSASALFRKALLCKAFRSVYLLAEWTYSIIAVFVSQARLDQASAGLVGAYGHCTFRGGTTPVMVGDVSVWSRAGGCR